MTLRRFPRLNSNDRSTNRFSMADPAFTRRVLGSAEQFPRTCAPRFEVDCKAQTVMAVAMTQFGQQPTVVNDSFGLRWQA